MLVGDPGSLYPSIVVPCLGTPVKLEDAIEFVRRLSETGPTVGASCRCFTGKSTWVFLEVEDGSFKVAEIRTQWCKQHEGLDGFRLHIA